MESLHTVPAHATIPSHAAPPARGRGPAQHPRPPRVTRPARSPRRCGGPAPAPPGRSRPRQPTAVIRVIRQVTRSCQQLRQLRRGRLAHPDPSPARLLVIRVIRVRLRPNPPLPHSLFLTSLSSLGSPSLPGYPPSCLAKDSQAVNSASSDSSPWGSHSLRLPCNYSGVTWTS
jgi:hypothetical protein